MIAILSACAAAGGFIVTGVWFVTWRLDVDEDCPPGEIALSRRKTFQAAAFTFVATLATVWGWA